MTKSSNRDNKDNSSNIEFQKQLEKKVGTWSDQECDIGFHAWIDKLNGAVVCYICGKVMYRNNSERPKP